MSKQDDTFIRYELKRKNVDENKIVTAPRGINESIKAKINKLMDNPDKPVFIPEKKEQRLPRAFNPPEFVHNIWGSSAGAGSGEFDVYRNIRRREYARQRFRQANDEKEKLDDEYHQKIIENVNSAEEKTSKKRAKRERLRKNKLAKKNAKKDSDDDSEDNDSDSEVERMRQEYREEMKHEQQKEEEETRMKMAKESADNKSDELSIKDANEADGNGNSSELRQDNAMEATKEADVPENNKSDSSPITPEHSSCDTSRPSSNIDESDAAKDAPSDDIST